MSDQTSIQQETGQTQPFRSKRQEAVVSLLRTASLLHRRFEELAQREGITFQQYNVLRILRGAGGPLPTMEIGERLVEQTPGITRLLDRLERKGLVRRARHPEDRRQVLCEMTQAGIELLRKVDGPVDALDEASMANLSEEALDELLRALAVVRCTLREVGPEGDNARVAASGG
jgi:MarR family 2-MHQ and catechol resistance regulon transcriptional repressor